MALPGQPDRITTAEDERDLTAAIKELTQALEAAGRGAGVFFADPGTRDRLITDIYQARRFQGTGLTAESLGMLPDEELLDLSRRLRGTARAADEAQRAAATAQAKTQAAMETLRLLGAGGAAEDVRVAEIGGRARDASRPTEQKRQELEQARRDREAVDANVATSDRDRKLAAAAVTRGELAVAVARRDLAEGTAERLGGMGAAGRLRAKAAFDLLKSVGFDYALPELVAQAAQYAPPAEVRAMKLKAGSGSAEFAAGQQEGLVGFEDVDTARRRADELRGQAIGQEAGADWEFL